MIAKVFDDLDFKGLIELSEKSDRFFDRVFRSNKGLVSFDDLRHLCFDLWKIVGCEFYIKIDVVIEAILNGWSNSKFSLGPKSVNSVGHHVRAGMADRIDFGMNLGFVKIF